MSEQDKQSVAPQIGPVNIGSSCTGVPAVCPNASGESDQAEGANAPFGELAASGPDVAACFREARNTGRFTVGNTLSLKHGARSARVKAALLPEQAEALAALAEKRIGIENDRGGVEGMAVIARDMVTRYIELDNVATWLSDNLQRHGALTGKGRQRAALTAYLGIVDRQVRLAQLLGLERKQKPVVSPLDYIDGKVDA